MAFGSSCATIVSFSFTEACSRLLDTRLCKTAPEPWQERSRRLAQKLVEVRLIQQREPASCIVNQVSVLHVAGGDVCPVVRTPHQAIGAKAVDAGFKEGLRGGFALRRRANVFAREDEVDVGRLSQGKEIGSGPVRQPIFG